MTNSAAAKSVKLGTLIERGVRVTYIDDMGDSWEHSVIIEAVERGQRDTKYPRYIDGERRCPPEDVGGIPGFEKFLDAITDAKHPDRAELIEWHDGCYGSTYYPDVIDELITKRRIAAIAIAIAIRRAAGKAAYAKRQA